MALSKEAWKQRVDAACALHGMDLSDLPDFDGLPQRAAARAGHASDNYQPNHSLALRLAEELELPVEWFEAEDWRPLVSAKAEAGLAGELQSVKTELLAGLSEVRRGLEALNKPQGRDERGSASGNK
jgi:hypothetical protein